MEYRDIIQQITEEQDCSWLEAEELYACRMADEAEQAYDRITGN